MTAATGDAANRRWKDRLVLPLGVIAAILLLRLASPVIQMALFPSDSIPFYSIAVGMTDQEVRSRLGAPDREYRRDDAPEDWGS